MGAPVSLLLQLLLQNRQTFARETAWQQLHVPEVGCCMGWVLPEQGPGTVLLSEAPLQCMLAHVGVCWAYFLLQRLVGSLHGVSLVQLLN